MGQRVLISDSPGCSVRLQPEVPLLSLARLVHLRVALAALVLGRTRSMEDGRIHDRAGRDADALGLQMHVDRLQHQLAQCVLLQKMAEAADGWSRPAPAPLPDPRPRSGAAQPSHTEPPPPRDPTG